MFDRYSQVENFLATSCVFSNVSSNHLRFKMFDCYSQVENFLATREESVERQRRLAAKTAMLRKTIRWQFLYLPKDNNNDNDNNSDSEGNNTYNLCNNN